MQCISFDAHKRYMWALVEDERGKIVHEERVAHRKGALIEFLAGCKLGSPVAVETIGNWYWMADEIEAAGMIPMLVNPLRDYS